MHLLADIAVAFVALLHLVFLVLEMFLWTKPSFAPRIPMHASTAITQSVTVCNPYRSTSPPALKPGT